MLTTILSMTFGFRAVQFAALGIYAIAAFAFSRLRYTRAGSGTETELDLDRSPRTSMTPRDRGEHRERRLGRGAEPGLTVGERAARP